MERIRQLHPALEVLCLFFRVLFRRSRFGPGTPVIADHVAVLGCHLVCHVVRWVPAKQPSFHNRQHFIAGHGLANLILAAGQLVEFFKECDIAQSFASAPLQRIDHHCIQAVRHFDR